MTWYSFLSISIAIIAVSLLAPSSLTVVVSAQEVQQPTYDCRTGCSLDANINGPPVCGIDQLTYLNECLAVCQNVAIVHYGPCNQDGSISESELSTDSEVVTMELMTRFISRGYRFVSKNTRFLSQPENIEESVVVSAAESASVGAVEDIEPYFVLFTPDGYEYAYRATDSLPSYPGPTPLYMGMQQLRERNLAIIGADTRTAITNTRAYPYRTIGEADFGTLEGGCTLTMISRNAAITAGHCVYNFQNKVPIQMKRIAPGRYRDSSGNTVEPFGTWEVETMQTFGQFKAQGNMTFDLAVVTFAPETRDNMQNCPYVYPGDVVGFLSLDRAQTSGGRVSDSRLASSTITGYPADFPNGVMATSGTCSKGRSYFRGRVRLALTVIPISSFFAFSQAWHSDHEHFAYHYCDTFGGNSGSAVITSGNVVIGEHAYGFYDKNNVALNNGAVMLTGQLYDSVYDWAGLGISQEACGFIAGPEPSADCACTKFEDRWFIQTVCFILNRDTCFRRNNK
ncbi:hypothetical protein FisN_9Hh364 [Fistulifera solaris]|jgi:V8-like Glu-specific endopeptidase|uniref:Serine protease n=1 Tax=Fistulifera solaris TaxID=1519565 RepID=A0A1Z5KDD2_FISSO|nr:hypothetical protein FisN_9Hh364 [Fistulifera solaris]|eukprot:GAX24111.1 hypothetical protein FisN_9Hh364 [Fistulifera solaris]